MTKPVSTIKRFLRPLIDQAVSRQEERHSSAAQDDPDMVRFTLLDHLVDILDGKSAGAIFSLILPHQEITDWCFLTNQIATPSKMN
jgi:hypothetical protein